MPRSKQPQESTYLRTLYDHTHEIYCTRCGGFLRVVLPMQVKDYCRQLDAFNRSHRRCEERQGEKAEPLPDLAPMGRCSRCNEPLNNVTTGISIIAGANQVCANCLKPGEEVLRARSL